MALPNQRLSYYSYDSLGNSWLSGGGALRDFEILKRQKSVWSGITVWVGAYPGFKDGVREGINYRGLGFGKSYLVSRLSFTLLANVKILFDTAGTIGNSLSAYAPILFGLFRGRRFFFVAHHYVGDRSQEKYSILGSVAWFSEWLMYKFCQRLIVSNTQVAERARSLNSQVDILKSQNGFDLALLEIKSEEAHPPFILFLGRFDIYMKGLDHLVEAYGNLKPELRQRVRLVLAGAASPKALAEMEKLVNTKPGIKIELIPNVPEEKKRELLRTCLFFCSPSRFEGWGIAALEANASGKAVLVTRADGFLDSIKEGYSGLMVALNDVQALTRGMEKLIEDLELRRLLESNARPWATQFTWDSIAEREGAWLLAD
jgi:glycosyltransferase involved in cell wall biosynthesis